LTHSQFLPLQVIIPSFIQYRHPTTKLKPPRPESAVPLYVLRGIPHRAPHKTNPQLTLKHSSRSPKRTINVPPPHTLHVDPRIKSQKSYKTNSSQTIPFVKQRETQLSPKNIKPHLVTLFPVCLRVLPFFDRSPKSQKSSNPSPTPFNQPLFQPFLVVLVKGLRADSY
jgi:hypothetical protein